MSNQESNDAQVPGYFLPEDAQFRLVRLGDHIRLLARLAQPRVADETRETAPEVHMGELAFCLELLAEQTDRVLAEVTWPARREPAARAYAGNALHTAAAETREGDAVPAEAAAREGDAVSAAPAPYGPAAERFAYGVTVEQIDALERLVQAIAAHGDVLAAGRAADLADPTVPFLGEAIHDAATTVRALLDDVEAQRLGNGLEPRVGVGEARAAYGAVAGRQATGARPDPTCPLPAVWRPERTGRPRSLRLH
ncbi:hypothetical protein H0E84_15565 [Luteimonas sp. SJ-92]|uniref:XAC0095-like domain-containing protein n=1 Tax=Luteimonas salinisoli TaxID=2752307 RepID=A0A853JEQ3_9GAMM|nr:hypothetical protein [Luteimonas salinisoli]NZA27796.1 hypothetical protein [Luteimonas salinisoli]